MSSQKNLTDFFKTVKLTGIICSDGLFAQLLI